MSKSLEWLNAICFLAFIWLCFHAQPVMAFLDRVLAP